MLWKANRVHNYDLSEWKLFSVWDAVGINESMSELKITFSFLQAAVWYCGRVRESSTDGTFCVKRAEISVVKHMSEYI